jgi:hypothetical protein
VKFHIKLTDALMRAIQHDLHRPHQFALERVGFITAGGAHAGKGVTLYCRDYHPVDDEDYESTLAAGAQIGTDAMRKALESALATRSALLHVHTHGGRGRPEFSSTDLRSAAQFVPAFFNALPGMPHGLVVLSNDSARGLIWTGPKTRPTYVDGFTQIGASVRKYGEKA